MPRLVLKLHCLNGVFSLYLSLLRGAHVAALTVRARKDGNIESVVALV